MSISVSDLMTELAAGEEARKAIPELNERIRVIENDKTRLADHNQALELRAKDREATIASLNERITSLIKARDDADFRALEVEDKLASFRKSVEGFLSPIAAALSGVSQANAALDPPKPAPTVDQPVVAASPEPLTEPKASAQPVPINEAPTQAEISGQSAAVPTNAVQPSPNGQEASTYQPFTEPKPEPGPYSGKSYYSKPDDVTWADWVAGGGEKAPWM